MNHYSIYWIREEFARFFYFRSETLYRFIKSYYHHQDRDDLATQFQYITMRFTKKPLISHMDYHQPSHVSIRKDNDTLKIYDDRRYISLHIEEKRINFRSDIIHDAEELLFPALRSFQPYLFVVGNNTGDFGWVSPVSKKIDHDRIGQVLYSYL